MPIHLNAFFDGRNVIHAEHIKDSMDAHRFAFWNKDKTDVITYNHIDYFIVTNKNVAEFKIDKNGHHYYDVRISGTVDIIDSLRISDHPNVTMSVYMGGVEYKKHKIDKVPLVCIPYHDCYIRITFSEKPEPETTIEIQTRRYILSQIVRKYLMYHIVETDHQIFQAGMCMSKYLLQ
jgi:hypothetical protein